jgi:hypothetical protein
VMSPEEESALVKLRAYFSTRLQTAAADAANPNKWATLRGVTETIQVLAEIDKSLELHRYAAAMKAQIERELDSPGARQ